MNGRGGGKGEGKVSASYPVARICKHEGGGLSCKVMYYLFALAQDHCC